jgi:hypothetical protein
MRAFRTPRQTTNYIKFEVLTAVTLKITVFWNVTCSMVDVYRRFERT